VEPFAGRIWPTEAGSAPRTSGNAALYQFSTVRKLTEGTVGLKTTSETRIHRNVYGQFVSSGTRDKPFMKTLKLLPLKLWFVTFASVEGLRRPLFVFMTQQPSVKVTLVWLCYGRWNAIIIMCSSHASDCTACLAWKKLPLKFIERLFPCEKRGCSIK